MTPLRKPYEKPGVQKVTLGQQEVSLYYTCHMPNVAGPKETALYGCESPVLGPCYENWPG